jgi:hypothetical protein
MAYNQPSNPFKFGPGSKQKQYVKEAKKSKFGIGKESRFEFTSRKRKEAKDKDKKEYRQLMSNRFDSGIEYNEPGSTARTFYRGKKLLNSKYLTDEEKAKLRAKVSISKPSYKEDIGDVLQETVEGDYPVYTDGSGTYVDSAPGSRGTLISSQTTRDMFRNVPLVEGMESYDAIKRGKELEPQLKRNKDLITGNIPSYLKTTDDTPSFFYKKRNKRARTMRGFRMKRNRR